MSRLNRFLRERGFYFALLACILMAALASVWAIRSMIGRMSREDSRLMGEEETEWHVTEEVPAPVQATKDDVPVTATPAPSSAPFSGERSVSEPSELQGEPAEPAEESAVSVSPYGWPVNGEILQAFSGDELVYNTTLKDWRTHNGLDIACDAGTEVRACTEGRVTLVEETGLFGTVVEVADSQGRTWRYCGLQKASVAADDHISVGRALGRVGTVESEQGSGSHLHLEVLQDGNYLDPARLIG